MENKEKKLKATVDGREVEVELIDGSGNRKTSGRGKPRSGKNMFRALRLDQGVVIWIALISIAILAVALFVWLLPFLFPFILVGVIINLLRPIINKR
ncbi:MAG: hypothetical protein PHH49_04865 [Candidatus Omnitrophica bacterium]|nr:hypothetical protein [Candidatus Omnitrophota bacterium]MDD5488276.1 hypothetical protein [Candidatus Omnitrophota bacterium]